MKRVIALLVLLAMMATSAWMLGGCARPDEDDYGAEIRAFFVGEVYDFDPAKAYTNDDAMKVLSLIYEPLFTLDANGNVQHALAKSHRFFLDYDGGFKLSAELGGDGMRDISVCFIRVFAAGHNDEKLVARVYDLNVVKRELAVKRDGNDGFHRAIVEDFSDLDVGDLHFSFSLIFYPIYGFALRFSITTSNPSGER